MIPRLAVVGFVILLAGVGMAAGQTPASSSAAGARRPNIVYILMDDLGKEWLSCYGAQGIHTPNIDALAAGGMRFNNAYVMPLCTPTRVTLLTGRYPFHHGWVDHWDVPRWGDGCHFDPHHNTTFAMIMRDAGYVTAAAGKWQINDFRVEPDAMRNAGFDASCMWTGAEGGPHIETSEKRYWDPYIHTASGSRTYAGKFGPDIFNDFLIDFMKRHKDQPMMIYYPMVLTHLPATTTPDAPHAGDKHAKFKAMVEYIDKMIGRFVGAIDELGIRRDTIIIVVGDNGTAVGNRRNGHEVRGSKAKLIEAGTALPMIVNGPGRVPAGVVTDALTDLTDMLPTFAALGDAAIPAGVVTDGHSITPLILGKAKDTDRQWIMSMASRFAKFDKATQRVVPAQAYDARVIRNKRWKLWVDEHRQPAKLYDMQADPWEQHNLIHSDDAAAVAAKQQLMHVIESQPTQDAAPQYDPNPPQAWDKVAYHK